jgi:casein kinase II subunit alpha
VTEEAIDLLNKMLKYDHAERVTPKDAMEHAYFKPVRDFHAKNGTN